MLLALCTAFLLLTLSLVVSILTGMAATALAATPITVGGTAIVTNTDGDPIRVREDAGYEFTPVTMAWAGDKLPVLDGPRTDKAGNKWFKVQARGVTGWMVSLYLEGTSNADRVARVTNTDGDPLRVRSAPNAEATVITRLNPGATVTIRSGPVADKEGITWYEISTDGIDGWAMTQYLTLEPAGPAPTATVPASRRNDNVPQAREASHSNPTATRTPSPPPAPAAPPTATAVSAPSSPTSTKAQYRLWMEEARAQYPYRDSIDKMWSVMMCESGGNPNASGGGGAWLGLFQYAPSTWRGSWNPYRSASIWDAKSQIFATAIAWSNGRQGWWTCY